MEINMVIGLMGAAGSGKDTVADYLVSTYGFKRHAFADLLYEEVSAAFDVPVKRLMQRDTKEQPMRALRLSRCHEAGFTAFLMVNEAPMLNETFSPRHILQQWGDYRRTKKPNYFIEPVIDALSAEPGKHVVSDVRFPNEREALIKLNASFWRIERPGIGYASKHASETALANAHVDKTIPNHGSLQELQRAIDGKLFTKVA
ncbi:hypothetical protein [Acidihalobacter ferrooxydans]|uniref:Deoxynucleotide monophosphate kinase n=1 Tax=Acidihalobacter ferrooxydans TaxID=1765967 RepID=A0A1P8UFE6_9GAMM|nr:hypothetical protein [Acidihalobacter ferrooxydans]APZ42519.1 hypothetical protein BW247_04950 [Acidihalobacter ferrooxydans]